MSNTATMSELAVEEHDYPSPDQAGTDAATGTGQPTAGARISHDASTRRRESYASQYSFEIPTPATGAETPNPLLHHHNGLPGVPTAERDHTHPTSEHHLGAPLENLARSLTNTGRAAPDETHELELTRTTSRRRPSINLRKPSRSPAPAPLAGLAEEAGSPAHPVSQGVPPELRNFTSEVIFILVCSAGQLLFAWFLGDVIVTQSALGSALGILNTQLPWLQGAFTLANGLSVILSGSLTDLAAPKWLIVGAFAWLTVWNTVGAFAITPERAVLFFVVRAMQGLAIGVLASGSMSILGRVYNPGLRKTRVFSCMASMAPFGFWLGGLQGGALASHLEWIWGSNALLCALLALAAYFTIPALKPVADTPGADPPTIRDFDYCGALCAIAGCVCVLFGLTQGSSASWAPYTYALIIVGFAFLVAFFFVERRVRRPLIPTRLWKVKGFTPLMVAYFFGFGSFVGPFQFYAISFWLRLQNASPLTCGLYLTPNAIMGVVATILVSQLMGRISGHWIFIAAMIAFGLGPVFFLPQEPSTPYWALGMPGIALASFGPDLSFAAASIFITSNVARSYQGSAGSMLMTVQNLSSAIMTSVGDSIGAQVDMGENGEIGHQGLRAVWWFGFGCAMLGAVITLAGVRIPKEEEKEHVT